MRVILISTASLFNEHLQKESLMITCYVRYQVDPNKIEAFESYAKLWIPLVDRFGGTHYGYFLPHESDNDLAKKDKMYCSLR